MPPAAVEGPFSRKSISFHVVGPWSVQGCAPQPAEKWPYASKILQGSCHNWTKWTPPRASVARAAPAARQAVLASAVTPPQVVLASAVTQPHVVLVSAPTWLLEQPSRELEWRILSEIYLLWGRVCQQIVDVDQIH